MLLLLTVMYWLAKYFLHILVLVSYTVISSLLTSRRGIIVTFFTFHEIVSVVQYEFIDLDGLPN